MEWITAWCKDNNLHLNTVKTKGLIVEFRKHKPDFQPLHINGACVERVSEFRFLCVRMTENLTCGANTTELVKKAQQRLYFLMTLQKNNNPQKLVVAFYCSSIGSILTYCLCVWYSSCTVPQRKALQRASRTQ